MSNAPGFAVALQRFRSINFCFSYLLLSAIVLLDYFLQGNRVPRLNSQERLRLRALNWTQLFMTTAAIRSVTSSGFEANGVWSTGREITVDFILSAMNR